MVASTTESHVPSYNEDDVEIIERAHRDGGDEVVRREDAEDEVDLQINRVLNMNHEEVSVTPSPVSVAAPAFSGQKIPFPNASTEDGKRNGYQILRLAQTEKTD